MISTDDIIDILAVDLIGIISFDEKIIASINQQKPIVLGKKCKTTRALNNITRRILGEDVEFVDFEEPDTFIGKTLYQLGIGKNAPKKVKPVKIKW